MAISGTDNSKVDDSGVFIVPARSNDMNEIAEDTCLTCLGAGEVSSERGVARCDDCDGSGKIGSVFRRNEQRIRQVEAHLSRLSGQAALDSQWLILELRRCRGALVKIMTAAQDTEQESDAFSQVRFFANEALGMYPTVDSPDEK
jgi:hypothetical protein